MLIPDLTALIQQEREREITRDRLARIAACARACCNPSLLARLSRAIHGTPATC